MAAVKSEAQQGRPKEQNRYDHVIGFRQPGRKADASEDNRKERRRSEIAASTAPIVPVVMRERSVIRGSTLER